MVGVEGGRKGTLVRETAELLQPAVVKEVVDDLLEPISHRVLMTWDVDLHHAMLLITVLARLDPRQVIHSSLEAQCLLCWMFNEGHKLPVTLYGGPVPLSDDVFPCLSSKCEDTASSGVYCDDGKRLSIYLSSWRYVIR